MKLKDKFRLKKLVQILRTKGHDVILDRLKNADSCVKDILTNIVEACSKLKCFK